MVHMDGYTYTSHQRSNRRRERPGSRARRTITRKSNLQSDIREGFLDALDSSIPLPSDKSRPSPLVRQNWDQSWQRWQARKAEEKALAEMDSLQFELEQQRLMFGGDITDDDDDELLYRLGILYNEEEGNTRDTFKTTSISCETRTSAPLFVIRPGKPRRNTRRPKWQSLPLLLSLSNLRDDRDIARLLSPQSTAPMTQHREVTSFPFPSSHSISMSKSTDIPQSLPTPSAFGTISAHGSINSLSPLSSNNIPTLNNISLPPHSLDNGDWTFINDASINTSNLTSPASETETWILLGDDS